MEQIFLIILNMSLTASYCIAVVILLRFLLKKQPKIFSYLLWSVVLFRLLCPFSLSSSYSLMRIDTNLIMGNSADMLNAGNIEENGAAMGNGQMTIPEAGQTLDEDNLHTVSPINADMEEENIQAWFVKVLPVISWVWLTGLLLLLGYSIISAFWLYRSLTGAERIAENQYEAEGLNTPFVFGIIKPRIYLPAKLQDEEKKYAVEHEKVHIVRKDYLIKMLAYAAVCIHWFNPLVWIAYILMETDMEMSCDEAVLRKMGPDIKKEYSMALLSLATGRIVLQGGPLAFGEGKVKGRVKNVLSYRKRALPTVILTAVFLIAVGTGLILNPIRDVLAGSTEIPDVPQGIAASLPAGLMDLIDNYATAFGNRDGAAVVDLYIDEETAFENVFLLEKAGGEYSLGMSSPWVDSFVHSFDQEEDVANIYYYAMVSDPHIFVWKEKVRYTQIEDARSEADEYKLTGSTLHFYDSISSEEEFNEAYFVSNKFRMDEGYYVNGRYQFVDYEELGFVDAINFQRENGTSVIDNTVYETPERAAEYIFNLKGGTGYVEGDYTNHAAVIYTFADGSDVRIPMRQVNDNEEILSGQKKPVWILDMEVWDAMSPYRDYNLYIF